VSDKMVEMYNETASSLGISSDRMHATRGDLLAPSDEILNILKESGYSNLNVVVMSMALHHVADPQLMLAKLVNRLTEGGRILIIDWAHMEDDVETSWPSAEALQKAEIKDVKHILNNATFSEGNVVELLKGAGCKEAEFALCPEISKLPVEFGSEKRLFFGLGKK
jgi:2-polyprenyl-3-methyl-5-hydroxy-6-metoxy-1,4-benzoquinol methylase